MAVDPGLEVKKSDYIVDVRTPTEKLAALTLAGDISRVFPIALLFVVSFALPAYLPELCVLLGVYYLALASAQFKQWKLPFEFPLSQRVPIKKEKVAGKEKITYGSGIYYLGNRVNHATDYPEDEVWISNDQARTHMLVMGTTGSGKSEFLKSLVFNSIAQGSGFIYIDGKADASLYYSLYSAIRAANREDDVLLINFQTGGKDVYGAQSSKLSNNLNILANGSSGMITETLRSIIAVGDKKDVWSARANDLVGALTRPLVYLRDNHNLSLDIGVYREFLTLDKLEELVWSYPNKYPGLKTFKQVDQLESFLRSLSGYKAENVGKQEATVHEQFGYVNMQLTAVVNAFADAYGYIMKTSTPEIDFTDVLMRRRILIVLLPALEKSPDELSNLGKIVVACVKATMAKGLGSGVEGDKTLVLDARPTRSLTPFPAVLDEYGYYAVEGFAVVCAQARSLGFMAVPAGQDLPAFEKGSKTEAKSMQGNTNVKLCGKIECDVTTKYFTELGGKATFAKMNSLEVDTSSVFTKHVFPKSVSFESSDRVSARDLRKQTSGEWHVYYGTSVVRMKGFYANPALAPKSHVNHFVPARRPSDEQVINFRASLSKLKTAIFNPSGSALGAVEFSGAVSNPIRFKEIAACFENFEKLPSLPQAAVLCGHLLNSRTERDLAYYKAMASTGGNGRRVPLDLPGSEVFSIPDKRTPDSSPAALSRVTDALAQGGVLENVQIAPTYKQGLSAPVQPPIIDGDSLHFGPDDQDFYHDDFAQSQLSASGSAQATSPSTLADSLFDGDQVVSPDEYQGEHFDASNLPPDLNDLDMASLQDIPLGPEPEATGVEEFLPERDQRLERSDIMTIYGSEMPLPPDDFLDSIPPLPGDGGAAQSPVPDEVSDLEAPVFDDLEDAGQGLLSRDQTISGIRELEMRAGASESDASMIAMSTAQDIAYSTAYPITPPSRGVNIADLMGITQRIVGLLQQADSRAD